MSGPVAPTPDQMAKLRSELDIVNGNIGVMGDMLNEMVPGEEDAADLELLHELNRTCRAMQTRLLELIEKISVEEVIEELLHVNDDLNNVFLRFERFERYRTGKTAAPNAAAGYSAAESAATPPTQTSPNRDSVPLIDLSSNPAATIPADAEEDVSRQLASLGIVDSTMQGGGGGAAAGSSAAAASKSSNFNANEEEIKEMEAWLGATGGGAADGGAGVSSSEFDDFLASRLGVTSSSDTGAVAAGDNSARAGAAAASPSLIRSIGDVPSISATSGAVPRVNRTPKKNNDDQDLLLG